MRRPLAPILSLLGLCLPVLGVLGFAGSSAAASAPAPQVYVALGDSYTSGPLIPNQHGDPIGCGRSDHNYPSLVDAAINPAVFRDVSCGSAVTENMTKPQSVPSGVNPPQFNALSADTTLVTEGIGGNDANLVGLAESCIQFDLTSPTGSPCKDHYTVSGQDTAAAGVDAIAPKIAAVLEGIHTRSPRARTLLVGYPDVLPLNGPGCWPVVPLSSGDVPWFRSLLVRINSVLAAQAKAHGAEYVDTYTASEGHDVCTLPGTRWFEGLLPTSPAYPLHPNSLGEASMSRSVLSVLGHPAPTVTPVPPQRPVAPRLRITRWKFTLHTLTVRGTISNAYTQRILVTFGAGAHNRVHARAQVRVRHGAWRVVLHLPGVARRVPAGAILARSHALGRLRAGRVRAATRATVLTRRAH